MLPEKKSLTKKNMLFENNQARVRFAPSPTGYLHLGGARTAVFNWLYARQQNGKFLLRIEDTDFERSDKKMVQAIFDGLRWLGLDWDEEVVYQSDRLNLYRKYCQQLVEKGYAYYCYCSSERLATIRHSNEKDRGAYFYDRHCRNFTEEKKQELEKQNLPRVVRFKVNPGKTSFKDEIHGSLTFDNNEIDDFVILRSDNIPTYHLAVVVDDFEKKITHVIRGDDHLTNTPKQVLLYQALNWSIPRFAHVPMILGSDKKRLSKRHGATAVSDFENQGYLPEAMLNFLALLGWSPGNNQEVLDKQELINSFDLTKVNKNSAIFDETKLAWMNSLYINQTSINDLYQGLLPFLKGKEVFNINNYSERYIKTSIAMLKSRLRTLTDFVEYGYYFFNDPDAYDEKATKKHWRGESLIERLEESKSTLANLKDFEEENIENSIRQLADKLGIGAGKLIHPIRIALTGVAVSPGIFELISVLGKEVTVRRLDKAIEFLKATG
jgi:nondiscriminating glutamyl-tRNA synthetase